MKKTITMSNPSAASKPTRKKRIAVIGLKGLPPFGGAANVGDNLIEQLSGEYDFTIYATASHTHHKGEYKGARQIVFKKFPIRKLNVFYYYIASAFHAVFSGRYDAVHLHHMDGAFTLLLLRLRYKVLATSHGLPYNYEKWSKALTPYFKLNEWFQARLSNHLTVVSKFLVPHYQKLIPDARISYIPNGVTPMAPATGELGASGYILFAAGRIIALKGVHTMLSALHLAGFKGKLIILGDHAQLKDYQRKIFDLAKGLDVEFKGLIKEKALLNAYIAGARLFIFPSTFEAMSMMLLEVACLRTPILCSDITQNTDIFSTGEMLFFKAGSETDLAEKFKWALDHPEEMREYAERAYNSLMEKFQWSVIARQYAGLIETLTARPTTG